MKKIVINDSLRILNANFFNTRIKSLDLPSSVVQICKDHYYDIYDTMVGAVEYSDKDAKDLKENKRGESKDDMYYSSDYRVVFPSTGIKTITVNSIQTLREFCGIQGSAISDSEGDAFIPVFDLDIVYQGKKYHTVTGRLSSAFPVLMGFVSAKEYTEGWTKLEKKNFNTLLDWLDEVEYSPDASFKNRLKNLIKFVDKHLVYKSREFGTNPFTIVERGTAVCEGYANLILYLGQEMGLPITTITNLAQLCHEWNVIRFPDGKWYTYDYLKVVASNYPNGYRSMDAYLNGKEE